MAENPQDNVPQPGQQPPGPQAVQQQPVSDQAAIQEYNLEAFYLAKEINLVKVAEKLDKNLIGKRREFLTYLLAANEYLFVFSFGAVVFINVAKEIQGGIKRSLSRFLVNPIKSDYTESYDLKETGAKPREFDVGADGATMSKVGMEEIEIASRILAQSVALNYIEDLTNEVLDNTEAVNLELEKAGKFLKSRKALLQLFGQNSSIIQFVVSKLSLLDKPAITWEKEKLEIFFSQLSDMFDLSSRFRNIQYKMDFVRDNSEFALGILQAQRENILTILIIILIATEILLYFLGVMD